VLPLFDDDCPVGRGFDWGVVVNLEGLGTQVISDLQGTWRRLVELEQNPDFSFFLEVARIRSHRQ
jgi:hypothetical protein